MKTKPSPKHNIGLIYLSLLAIIAIGSYFLTLIPNRNTSLKVQTINAQRERITSSQLPALTNLVTFPTLSAQGVIAIDLDSSVVLYEKNPDMQLLPASTTKIMTALVAMDYYNENDVITVGSINVVGQKMRLVSGEKISFRSLLDGLLIFSANDAAEVIAANYCEPGELRTEQTCGRAAFISAMNKKAGQFNMTNTYFVNPVGLDNLGHYSSVRDLVRLSDIAMKNPTFAEIVGTKKKTVTSIDKKIIHPLNNVNELLEVVEGVKGVKTGWTEGARENLVTYIVRTKGEGSNPRRILVALLGSQDRFGETKQLIEWIFRNMEWNDVVYNKTP